MIGPKTRRREDAKARREKRFEGKKEPGQGSKLALATQEPRHAFPVLLSILFFSSRLRVFASSRLRANHLRAETQVICQTEKKRQAGQPDLPFLSNRLLRVSSPLRAIASIL